ncbi:MAG: TonB family protein [Leptolyngbyaceae cyanobacterium SM1_4_3]|nr:TonB family protein [Leptolyngbyaceae cyanobacterium SM1_4_3]
MSLAQKHRDRFAAQRGSLTIYLAVATAFHGGMMAGGILPWQQTEPPNLAVEPMQPIEFVYLETEAELDQDRDRRSNLDAIAGGEAKPNQPVAIGKPGIEESLRDSTTGNKIVAPLASAPSGRIVPASSAVPDNSTKAVEPEADVKPSVTPAPQQASPPHSSNRGVLETSNAAPTASNNSAFADLPQLEPDLFSPDSTRMNTDPSNSSERSALSEATVPGQPASSQSPSTAATPSAVSFEAALNLGRELAEIANSNRTAANELGVDAEQDPILGEYLAEMDQQIKQQWRQIQVDVDADRSVEVRFTVSQQGELVQWEVTQSSRLAIADEAAVQAIQRSAPFEPLPPEANREQLTRTLTFHYSIRQSTL